MSSDDPARPQADADEPGAGEGEAGPPAGEAPTAQIPATSVPLRRCPECSSESRTAGEFCPHCGARFDRGRGISGARPARLITLALVGILVAAGAVLAFLAIQHADERAGAERHGTQLRAQREAAARRENIARRRQLVRQLALSVATKAAKGIARGVMEGPIRRTVCTPLGATNPNDLTQHTGRFECIAISKDNPDGSYEGYRFSARVNYDSASYRSRLEG